MQPIQCACKILSIIVACFALMVSFDIYQIKHVVIDVIADFCLSVQ